MNDLLSNAAERFKKLVQSLPDSELVREWAWGSYTSEGVRFAFFRNYEDLCHLAVQVAHARDLAGKPLSGAQRILAQYQASFMNLQAVMSAHLISGSFSASEYIAYTSHQNPGISPSFDILQ